MRILLRSILFILSLPVAFLQAQPSVVATGNLNNTPDSPFWEVGGHGTANLIVGDFSPGTLTISGGGYARNLTGIIGNSSAAAGSAVTVTGSDSFGTGSNWRNNGSLSIGGASSSNNTLTISANGKVSSYLGSIGGGGVSDHNAVTVSGMGSTWTITFSSSTALRVGGAGSDNTLTVEDSALVRLDGASSGLVFSSGGGTDNFLRLNGGFVALQGDQTAAVNTFLTNGNIQVWDGAGWVNAAGNPLFAFTYFTDSAAAFAATGYTGLGGYTILGAAAVPEPSTYGLIAGLLGLGLAARRRRKQ